MRPSNTTERRSQIVDALAGLLGTHSYAEASVGRIAREAGLTTGLVHYHFGSKREILLALVDRLVDAWRERLRSRVDGARGPVRRIRAVVDATLAVGDDADPDAAALWTTLGAEAARQPDVAARVRIVLRDLHSQLVEDLEMLDVREPDRTARALLAAMEGTFRLAAMGLVPAGEGADGVHRLVDALLVER
jgi:TetR/AcrR family transcriptional repressor of bet genes